MRFSRKEQRVRNGYFTAFALLLISYVLVFLVFKDLEQRVRLVNHKNDIIINLEKMVSTMKDAETGVRGYVIMRQEEFLGPFQNSRFLVDSVFTFLHMELSSDALQSKRLDTIGVLIKEKFLILQQAIHKVRDGTFKVLDLPENGYRGFYVMNEIRRIVVVMQQQEERFLMQRSQTLNSSSVFFKGLIVLTLIFSVFLALYSFILFDK